jgi:hypothetical protein
MLTARSFALMDAVHQQSGVPLTKHSGFKAPPF